MPGRAAPTAGVRRGAAPVASLPLQLPAPSPLPGRISPEQAVPCAVPFDAEGWQFSIDWEGARALLFVDEDGGIRLQASNLSDVTRRFPELRGIGHVVRRRPAVLDGVIAVLDPSGRPDLGALAARLAAPERRGHPAVFLATDVLHVDGAPVLRWPLERRLHMLGAILESDSAIQMPDHVAGQGLALADAAAARGLARILARRSDAPYRPGVASPDRLRIDLAPRASCVVVGAEPTRRSPVGRLVLAEHVGGRLVLAARVDGPRDAAVEPWLRRRVLALTGPRHASVAAASPAVRWLRPQLTADVAYARRLPDGRLQDARLLAVRDDVDSAWCVRRPAQDPPQDGRNTAFLPTVLMPLPLDDSLLLPRQRS